MRAGTPTPKSSRLAADDAPLNARPAPTSRLPSRPATPKPPISHSQGTRRGQKLLRFSAYPTTSTMAEIAPADRAPMVKLLSDDEGQGDEQGQQAGDGEASRPFDKP